MPIDQSLQLSRRASCERRHARPAASQDELQHRPLAPHEEVRRHLQAASCAK
jgi:hypothetical protein